MGFKRAAGSMPTKRMAKKAKTSMASLTRKVNRIAMQIESKNKDYAIRISAVETGNSGGIYSPTGSVQILNEISQGDGSDNRAGRKILCTSLQLRMHLRTLERSTANSPSLPTHRNIIVWDKQPNSASGGFTPPDVSEILDFSGVINGEEALAPIRLDNSERFVILFDDTNGLEKPGVTSDSHVAIEGVNTDVTRDTTISKYIPINQGMTIFNGTGGPTTGALLWVTVGNRWSNVTNGPGFVLNYTARVRFTDA